MASLELKQLTKKFGDFTAVDSMDLQVADGEMIALLGGSGCGKTTTLRMIAGFTEPFSGSILVDGKDVPYTPERLSKMYHYLNEHGELYFIELLRDHTWVPVGDVTFWQKDMPIVIGDHTLRGKGIGRQVVSTLIRRARKLGYHELFVDTIYDYNTGSRMMFESCGFVPCETTANGHRYRLILQPETPGNQ